MSKLDPREMVLYSRAVWFEFCKLRGAGHMNPTAREYWLLSKWMDAGIPLPVVLRAFGEFAGKPRLLTAMEAPVSKAYAYYRQALALGSMGDEVPL